MQICDKSPAKWNTERNAEHTHIINKTGINIPISPMNIPSHKKDTNENANNSGFYEVATGVCQSCLVFLLSLFFFVLGLLLLVILNLNSTGIAQTGRMLFGTLSA